MGGESNKMLQRAVQKLLSAPLLPPLPLLLWGSLFFFSFNLSAAWKKSTEAERKQAATARWCLRQTFCQEPAILQGNREVGEDTYFGSILHMQFVPVIILITAQVTQDFTKHTATN